MSHEETNTIHNGEETVLGNKILKIELKRMDPADVKFESITEVMIKEEKTQQQLCESDQIDTFLDIELTDDVSDDEGDVRITPSTEAKLYKCELCLSIFSNSTSLNGHLRRVHVEATFQCPLCPLKKKSKGTLRNHIKESHLRPFKCNICHKAFGNTKRLETHKLFAHSNISNNYACEICGRKFKVPESVKLHVKNVHYFTPTLCSICGTLCTSCSVYQKHLKKCRNPSEKVTFTCDYCNKDFSTKCSLQYHIYKHLEMKPFQCEICQKQFSSINYLGMHRAVHNGKTFQCYICTKAFNRRDNMIAHVRRQH